MSSQDNSTFTVESILHNLKEVQHEKMCLEKKLNEQRNKRRSAEKEFDIINMKFLQITDIHHKMTETLKVAQLKVTQTQAQADSLEENNERRRGLIADINRKIDREIEKQQREVLKFEEELSDLASKLVAARNHNKDDNLEGEIQEMKDKKEELRKQKKSLSVQLDDLDLQLQSLSLEKQPPIECPEISEDMRREIWNMLKKEKDECLKYLDELKTSIDSLKSQQTQLISAQ